MEINLDFYQCLLLVNSYVKVVSIFFHKILFISSFWTFWVVLCFLPVKILINLDVNFTKINLRGSGFQVFLEPLLGISVCWMYQNKKALPYLLCWGIGLCVTGRISTSEGHLCWVWKKTKRDIINHLIDCNSFTHIFWTIFLDLTFSYNFLFSFTQYFFSSLGFWQWGGVRGWG